MLRRLRLFDRPYLLLVLAVLFWSGNFVLGRAVRLEVPPVALAFWRWCLATALLLPFGAGGLQRDLPLVRRHLPLLALLSLLGVGSFNTLIYLGLQEAPAVNALLMQSTMPVLIVALSFLLFRERLRGGQAVGVGLSLLGALVIVTGGELRELSLLALGPGEGLFLLAVALYAGYSVCLRLGPKIAPLSFLIVTFALGAATLLPFYLWESAYRPLQASAPALLAIAYVAVFPSVLSFLFFNRGVQLVGANRAGLFIHLMPVFGSLLAVLLLGEELRAYHLWGAALIGLGILLAVRPRRAAALGRGA